MGRRPDTNLTLRFPRRRAWTWVWRSGALVGAVAAALIIASSGIVAANPRSVTTSPVRSESVPDAPTPEIYGPVAPTESATLDDAPHETPDASTASTVSTPAIERQPIGPAGATDPVHAPTATQSTPTFSTMRTIAALAVVVVLIFALKWGVKRAAGRVGSMAGQLGPGGKAPSGVLSILARYPVGRGQSLVLLHMDQRVLLLNQTPDGFKPLAEVTDPEEVASLLIKTRDEEGDSLVSRFSSLLSRFESDPEFVDRHIVPTQTPTSVDEALRVFPQTATDRAVAPADDDPLGAIRARLEQMEGASA